MAEKRLNCGINKTLIMATKITVPDIGDFENVEIIEVLTKPGAIIKKNDPIVTLESDKSSVEVPSPFSGKISSLEVKIGDKVSKGSILATIEDEKNEISEKVEKLEKPSKASQEKETPLILQALIETPLKSALTKEALLKEQSVMVLPVKSALLNEASTKEELFKTLLIRVAPLKSNPSKLIFWNLTPFIFFSEKSLETMDKKSKSTKFMEV